MTLPYKWIDVNGYKNAALIGRRFGVTFFCFFCGARLFG